MLRNRFIFFIIVLIAAGTTLYISTTQRTDLPTTVAPSISPAPTPTQSIGTKVLEKKTIDDATVSTAHEHERVLQELYPNYSAAARALKNCGYKVLPSVSAVYAKSRQFNDGLFAALELALTVGLKGEKEFEDTSTVALIYEIARKVDRKCESYPFLFASLSVAGFSTTHLGPRTKHVDELIAAYFADTVNSKPIGFNTWSQELQQTWHFLHFLQQPSRDRAIAEGIARVLINDKNLQTRYQTLLKVYAKLMYLLPALTPVDMADPEAADTSLAELWLKKNIGGQNRRVGIYCFPYQLPVEMLLVERIVGNDEIPASTDLLKKLAETIRAGKLEIKPNANSGAYNYQEYALAALIDGEKSQQGALAPHLRIESAPTYYLRQARVYRFFSKTLPEILPSRMLSTLHGVRENGRRELPLQAELVAMQQLLYGFYFIACKDLKIQPELEKGEVADAALCLKTATEWIEHWTDDPDLNADARFCVPIMSDSANRRTQYRASLGVHATKNGDDIYLIEDHVSFERNSLTVLNEEELRIVCNREKISKTILEALKR